MCSDIDMKRRPEIARRSFEDRSLIPCNKTIFLMWEKRTGAAEIPLRVGGLDLTIVVSLIMIMLSDSHRLVSPHLARLVCHQAPPSHWSEAGMEGCDWLVTQHR